MSQAIELKPEQLRQACDEALFDFETTSEISELADIIGQDRAIEAIEFGMGMESDGFNIFALGPPGAGRMATIQRFVQEKAKEKTVPEDWCYVYNFADPNKPNAIPLPAGKGKDFRSAMDKLVLELKREIRQALEREDYENERNAVMERLRKEQGEQFSSLDNKAHQAGFDIQRGPTGVFVVPMHGGQPLTAEQFQQLAEDVRQELEQKGDALQQELQKTLRTVRDMERKARDELRDLERKTVLFAVEYHIDLLQKKYKESGEIVSYLDSVQEDVVENARDLLSSEQSPTDQPMPFGRMPDRSGLMERYTVNLIVDNSGTTGAPVVVEHNPTFHNLIGRLERQAHLGMLITDFKMIKPGSLHRANGGYLILEADHLFRQPLAYDALKHAIKEREIKIQDVGEMYSMISTAGVEPEPIPLAIKVILIGNPFVFYTLQKVDEEFSELFKVKADFNTFMDRNHDNTNLYARFLSARCNEKGWSHFDRSGIARMVEFGSEMVGDQTKLSTRFADICNLASEADYWSKRNGNNTIGREDVQKAIDTRRRRSNRVEERIQEMIEKGDIFIDTDGMELGQVNGLSVMSMGDYSFGKPSRITARTYVGRGGIVNIEREVKMSGPIHDKGVLILAGYLNGKYGRSKPISLSASIGFEQSYEGIEGDSASSTELYALLSSISGHPIKQGLAVTGSVNQMGEIQPIGGATEKIEGFFDVCKANGLTGEQGVLVPKANAKNLMLREEIVEVVSRGQFHIYSVSTIDEGMEILTGVATGKLQQDGTYPEGTVNSAVDKKLSEFAECWKEFQQKSPEEEHSTKRSDSQNGKA